MPSAAVLEALSFYANPKNWLTPSTGFAVQYDPEPSPVAADKGARAATALAAEPTAATHFHLFHPNCPKAAPGRVAAFVPTADTMDQAVLSQVKLACECCGSRVHVDVWPMQPIDVTAWTVARKPAGGAR